MLTRTQAPARNIHVPHQLQQCHQSLRELLMPSNLIDFNKFYITNGDYIKYHQGNQPQPGTSMILSGSSYIQTYKSQTEADLRKSWVCSFRNFVQYVHQHEAFLYQFAQLIYKICCYSFETCEVNKIYNKYVLCCIFCIYKFMEKM